MVDLNRLCLGCMNALLPHPNAACPRCNWSRKTDESNVSQLPAGTYLKNPTTHNRYLVGKALGQGGFGIVYVAWDLANDKKVAIKEYFPSTPIVGRTHSNSVTLTPDTPQNQKFFNAQKERFRQEAEKMQKFNDSPNVVNVIDFFEANRTAYIVMEFIEGRTLIDVLNDVPGSRQSLEVTLYNLRPLVNILERIHKTPWTDANGTMHTGIIHRDISPENIMFSDDKTIKLLDFGSSRGMDPNNPFTQIVKHGYAPYEQYLSVGPGSAQGPWTDVYSFAATIYRAITGKLPPDGFERSNSDTLQRPSSLGVQISVNQERVLLKGLAVRYQDRYHDIRQFYEDLSAGLDIPTINPQPTNSPPPTEQQSKLIPPQKTNPPPPQPPQITPPPPPPEPTPAPTPANKIPWVVAVIALIAAFMCYSKMSSGASELAAIRSEIQNNQAHLERYGSFPADYGYASASYYAEKAIVFVNRNSEAKVSIYCDLFRNENDVASLNCVDGSDIITVKWENKFDANHLANVIITAGNKSGYSTLKFANNVNGDNFEVLVVVQ